MKINQQLKKDEQLKQTKQFLNKQFSNKKTKRKQIYSQTKKRTIQKTHNLKNGTSKNEQLKKRALQTKKLTL